MQIDPILTPSKSRDIACLLSALCMNALLVILASFSFLPAPRHDALLAPIQIQRIQVSTNPKPAEAIAPISPAGTAPMPIAAVAPQLVDKNKINKKNSAIQKHSVTKASSKSETLPAANDASLPDTTSNQNAEPSQEAFPVQQIQPEIPSEVKSQDYKSYVSVKVEIQTDGSSIPYLKTSSGNDKVDNAVLAALSKWKWHPAEVHDQPVSSVRYFRFEFEVH